MLKSSPSILAKMRLLAKIFTVTGLIFAVAPASSNAQSTYPAPPKVDANNEYRLQPASDLVGDFSKVRLIVTDESMGRKIIKDKAPVYRIDEFGLRQQVDSVDVGSEVKVDRIASKLGRNYFGYFIDEKVGKETVKSLRWVDGMFLKYEWKSTKL